jgi:hypothetical protein
VSVTIPNAAARTVLGEIIVPLFPPKARWQLVEHEGTVDDSDRVRVRITQRSIRPSDTGAVAAHLVTFAVTITVPTETLEGAEAQLDDDLDLFLHALDAADVPWTTATKGRYADEGNRLGYQLDVEIRTTPNQES